MSRAVGVAIAVATIAAACGGDDSDSSEAETSGGESGSGDNEAGPTGEAPGTVRIGLAGGVGVYPPHDIAVAMGQFDEIEETFDTQVEVTTFDTGPNTNAALAGGSVDFTTSSAPAVLSLAEEDQPVTGLLSLGQGGAVLLVGQKQYEEDRGTGFEALAEYDGGRWGVVSVGGLSATFVREAAESVGVDFDSQDVVATGGPAAAASAISAGRLDIAAMDAFNAAGVVDSGAGYIVASMSDQEEGPEVWGDQLGTMVLGRNEFVDQYPELTQAMVRAWLQGLLAIDENADDPSAAYESQPEELTSQLPPEVFEIAWPYLAETFNQDGLIRPAAVDNTVEFLTGIGQLSGQEDYDVFDDSFAREAYQDLGLEVPR